MKRFLLLYGFVFAILAIANNTINEKKEDKKIIASNKVMETPKTIDKNEISISKLQARLVNRDFALNTAND